MDFDARKLEELSRRFQSSPGSILDLMIDLRNRGCPPEMLEQALLDELAIGNIERVSKRVIVLFASCQAILSILVVFLQINFLPKNYKYDSVLKAIIGWGFFGTFCTVVLAILLIVLCRKIINMVNVAVFFK